MQARWTRSLAQAASLTGDATTSFEMTPRTERMEKVISLRDSGWTFRKIGKEFGVTGSRASVIYRMGLIRRRREGTDPLYGLPTRVKTVLFHAGIASKEEALAGIKSGKINLKLRNFGKLGYIELCQWLGVKPDIPKRVSCPHCGRTMPQ